MQFKGRFVLFVLAAIALFMTPGSAQPEHHNPWENLQFLLGTWTGTGSGKPGEATAGETTFSFDLDKKIMVRRNRAEYAPKPGDKTPIVHEDLMMIYPQPGRGDFRAIYFDNEGHVIQYTLSFPEKQPAVVFESEASDKAPRFRLIHELSAKDVMNTEFFIAPPGGEFKPYVKGTTKKKPPLGKKQ